jgi:hypothetical protein
VFVACVLGLKLLYWNGIVQGPTTLGNLADFGSRLGLLVVFALYYIGVLRSAFRIGS